jgi:glutamine amidotransferase
MARTASEPNSLDALIAMPMRPSVGIVDYDAGNLRSLQNALEAISAEVRLVRDPSKLNDCTHLVLPGVGAFAHCFRRLRESGMAESLTDWATVRHRPLLGICVGMQMLADAGEEHGESPGLGWIPGRVRRLPVSPGARVPHVGWNGVHFGRSCASLDADYYFDHSFQMCPADKSDAWGVTSHGESFCSAVRRGSIIGVQFHPEKSQEAGLRFLHWFLERSAESPC